MPKTDIISIEREIKRIEATVSPILLVVLREAFEEYLRQRYGKVDTDKLDRMLNLNASALYAAVSGPMYEDSGITLR